MAGHHPGRSLSPVPHQHGSNNVDMYRVCRIKRKSVLFCVMVSGFLCFVLYTLSFSCCLVINAGLAQVENVGGGRRIILLDSNDNPERLQRDLDEVIEGHPHHHHHHRSMMRKTLLQPDEPGDDLSPASRRDPGLASFDQVPRTEEDFINGYNLENSRDSNNNQNNVVASDDNDDADYYNSEKSQRTGIPTDRDDSSNTILRTTKSGTKKLPQALIIGVKKGGTRALLEFLRVHPDIRAPGPEPHFFDRHYNRGLEWYRKQMPTTLEGQITVEKTPSYFVTKGVPGRIFNMSKGVKLIIVVRDPVTRAISDYTQAASKRTDVKPFEQMAFLDNSTGLVDTSWGAIRIGVYAKHLERWLKYFPLEQIQFVNGEKLITDPAGELYKVQDFLGLKRVISGKHFYFNSTKGFPCLKKPEGSGNPHCLGKTKGRQHPKVDPKVIKRLRDFYRPFNAKFYQMVNQDFGWP